jgi:MinD-like ATPase involved in chromosome partitioning or flagellar assembly
MAAIVSVHSYRGGTGKSNTTANLAVAVALAGKRVGVVDTDIQSPGIHVLFGLKEHQTPRTLNDYLYGRCAIEDTAVHVTPPEVMPSGGRVFLIPSSMNATDIAKVLRDGYDVSLLSDGFDRLFTNPGLDYLFIDTHPGLNEETLLSLAMSDMVLLIVRPDKQDFLGTAVTVEVARRLGVPRMALVLNKVLPRIDLPALIADAERTLQVDVGAAFRLTEELMQLGSQGLLRLIQPNLPWSREIDRLAAVVLGKPTGPR